MLNVIGACGRVPLIRIGFEHPDVHDEIVCGASDNECNWRDNQNAFRLGYRPKHRSEDQVESARWPARPS